MKKILVIGAGIGQINIIRLAKEMGLYVIVVSPKGYPAIEFADELFECDIYEYDSIVKYAINNHINAVISDQNDLMVPTVAYVAERLNIPGLTFEQALSYCDKNRFRKICREIDVPVPNSISVTDSQIIESFKVSFPWIVKPADSQSSIGISKIECREDYEKAVNYALSKSKHHSAIVEQFFTGDEHVCEGFIYKGNYYNLFIGDRRYFKNTLIPSQTLFPSELDYNIQCRIIDCEKRISRYINAPFGIVHSEYLVNKESGDFIVVESAIRGGGVYISSHLVPLATGIDINRILLSCALGEEKNVDFLLQQKKSNAASAYVCFTLPEGIISTIQGIEDVANIPGVDMCDIRNMYIGQKTDKMTVKGQRKGPIIIHGKNRQELDEIIKKIQQTINIKVIGENNSVLTEIWD